MPRKGSNMKDYNPQIFVSYDPRVLPIDAPKDAEIVYQNLYFQKMDNGSSTNVELIEVSGVSGFSGLYGPSGHSGYSGLSGISGTSGSLGNSGNSGYSGKSGYSGVSGYSGYSSTLNQQMVESQAVSTTTSTTYQTKASLALSAGTYIIHYCAEINNSTASRNTDAKFDIGGVVYSEITYRTVVANFYQSFSGVKIFTVSSSSTVTIQYRVTTGSSGTAGIRNARIVAIRSA